VIEKDGIRVVVDNKSKLYLADTTLDYEDGLSGKGFTFLNPNARQTCGCGESFSF
jgi:iron-sulfur cluster assembly protein